MGTRGRTFFLNLDIFMFEDRIRLQDNSSARRISGVEWGEVGRVTTAVG
ncbi:hypothetical protein DOT_3824 [Desulfosporosinus sp. OT]|nr:hypothetical protein DOT_3824 [Desulfosporosinus sp. OT]